MFAAYFDCPGGPENLYMKEVMKPDPGEGEILVKVSASALNRADLLQRRGKYPPPKGASDILGLEAAGSVAGLGPGCSGQWRIGDAVMALLSGGGQAQYVTVPEGLLMPIPKDMTFTQAAAIPEAWLTAFQLLHFVGERCICPFIPPKQLIFLSVTKSSLFCLHLNVVCSQRTFSLSLCSYGSESGMPDTNP